MRKVNPGRFLRCRLLGVESLESRIALDSQGVLVGVDPHFTLSFIDDGVAIGKASSTLHQTMDSLAPQADWREAILRAFQTWAVHTNSDIAVVADGGQPLGSAGASQGDSRFGDIRVGATTMSMEVGAVSVPIDNVASGSWLADVIFNDAFNYQSLNDLLAVATHEAGNVFGLEDNADPNSPLFSHAAPAVHTPTAADIAALQALHGVRVPDANEVHNPVSGSEVTDNNSLENATVLELSTVTGFDEGSAPTIVFGDIHDLADVDYFTLRTPADYSGSMTVRLRTSGVSLLQPEIWVYSSSGQAVARAVSNVVGGSLITLQVASVAAEQDYYFRISGADPGIFSIGGYSLAVTFDGRNLVSEQRLSAVTAGEFRSLSIDDLAKLFDDSNDDFYNEDGGTNEAANAAVELETSPGFVEGTRYETLGSIVDKSDVDYYSVKSPRDEVGAFGVMTVFVRSLDAGGLIPEITVFDEDQTPVPAKVIVNGAGEVVVQVTGVAEHKDYQVRVSASDPTGPFISGNYELRVAFSNQAAAFQSVATGQVGGATIGNSHTLYVGKPQLFHFVLAADVAAVSTPTAVVAVLKDDQGSFVTQIGARTGQTRSVPAVLLDPGTYTVDFYAISLDGSGVPAIGYDLSAQVLSDPFVGDPSDPTNNPFACPDPELAGFYCYPGNFISADPYLWDDFIASLPEAPQFDLQQVVNLLIGDWWTWVWDQIGLNGPVLAQNDRFEVEPVGGANALGFARIVAPPNVLANDIDPEGGAVTAVLLNGPSHGTLTLDPDGTVHYTPNAGFVGTDSFTYIADDFVQQAPVSTAFLVVGTGIAGDYNSDGVVDELDGDAWRAAYGSTTSLLADGNKDMVVNAADYTLWRDAFATQPQPVQSQVATTPTPSPPRVQVLEAEPVFFTIDSIAAPLRSAPHRLVDHASSRDAAILLLFAEHDSPRRGGTSVDLPKLSQTARAGHEEHDSSVRRISPALRTPWLGVAT